MWNYILLTWSENCIIVTEDYGNRVPKFAITDTTLYVQVVTLWTQDNEKLLKQLKIGFKRTINGKKYELESKIYTRNRHLIHSIDPSFQWAKIFFVLSFKHDTHQRSYKWYFYPTVEIKDCNTTIVEKIFFDQPVEMV